MVDVSAKAASERAAIAEGRVVMAPATLALIRSGEAKKGDVLGTARIAGIMAAKRTHELIPLCHPLALTSVSLDLTLDEALPGVVVRAEAKTQRADRRRDGGADRRRGRLPDDLRHGQGGRPRHAHRSGAADREARRQIRPLAGGAQGVSRPALTSVEEALALVLASVPARSERRRSPSPKPSDGRWRATSPRCAPSRPSPIRRWTATRCAPPTPRSAPARLRVVGESAAGHAFAGRRRRRARRRAFSPARRCPKARTRWRSRSRRGARARTSILERAGRAGRAMCARRGLDFAEGEALLAGRAAAYRARCRAGSRRQSSDASGAPPAARRHSLDRRRTRRAGRGARAGADRRLQRFRRRGHCRGGGRRADRPWRRRRRSERARRRARRGAARPRRCAGDARRRFGRRPRSGAPGAHRGRHGARLLAHRHAAGQAADPRPTGRNAACSACRAIRPPRPSARSCSCVRCVRALLGDPAAGADPSEPARLARRDARQRRAQGLSARDASP